jgi:ABC-2 type transport system permease protein
MSAALRDRFASEGGAPLTFRVVDEDGGSFADTLLAALRAREAFSERTVGDGARAGDSVRKAVRAAVRDGDVYFALVIPAGFSDSLTRENRVAVSISASPDVGRVEEMLFAAAVREATARAYAAAALADLDARFPLLRAVSAGTPLIDVGVVDDLVRTESLYAGADGAVRPTSVQQSVPAWLLFAMFFIALPLSTTWIQERRQGTLARLRSLGVGAVALLAGRALPYTLVNWIQAAVMLAVGLYVVPLIGGGRLDLGSSPAALALMTVAASFAAVSCALLMANLVSTTEQATVLAGTSILLLAALGGVLVPRFVMPAGMQHVSSFSPMAWGLDGFLDCFLRGGTVASVLPNVLRLTGFGAVAFAASAWLLARRGAQ